MKIKLLITIVLVAAFIAGCVPATGVNVTPPTAAPATTMPTSLPVIPTSVPPTSTNEEAPTEVVSTTVPSETNPVEVGLVIQTIDHQFHFARPTVNLTSPYAPTFTGFNPRGGMISGIAYAYDYTTFPTVMAFDGNEAVQLDFIVNPMPGLAVWSGTQPRLAWGTMLQVPDHPSSLEMSAPDGSTLETLITQGVTEPPSQIIAQAWSVDGNSLYFSREPSGIGGYIVFSGASSLYKIDLSTYQKTELIPADFSSGPFICLDALSADERYVADHCLQKSITIKDLSTGASTSIQPPEGLAGFQTVGSARFSPNGSRVAFALAKNDPNNEQGWIAVSDELQGSSQLILAGDPGVSYQVVGWLSDQTLLIQSSPVPSCVGCDYQLWTLNIDGTNLTKIADGSFVTSMDSR